jgi:isoleucyl-tRNA synthetase
VKLGIKSKDDVLRMGVAAYNQECRSIVSRYVKEWEVTVKRTGRWIDFEVRAGAGDGVLVWDALARGALF